MREFPVGSLQEQLYANISVWNQSFLSSCSVYTCDVHRNLRNLSTLVLCLTYTCMLFMNSTQWSQQYTTYIYATGSFAGLRWHKWWQRWSLKHEEYTAVPAISSGLSRQFHLFSDSTSTMCQEHRVNVESIHITDGSVPVSDPYCAFESYAWILRFSACMFCIWIGCARHVPWVPSVGIGVCVVLQRTRISLSTAVELSEFTI